MFFIEKLINYKYTIIGIMVCLGVVFGVVYYLNNNEEEASYEIKDDFVNVEAEEKNNVIVEEIQKIKVHISGEVVSPGVIELEEGARIIDAVNKAGGLKEEADISRVNLAFILEDAMKVYIPNKNEIEADEVVTFESGGQEVKQTKKVMINLNTATVEELQKLDGIGISIAQKIVQYRKENGKFGSIEELKKVSGIGESKYDCIKDNIYVK